MRASWILLMGAALAGGPAAASAQAPGAAQAAPAAADLMQRAFTFIGTELRVTVAGSAPGTIQVLRGEPGIIGLSTRTVGGLPTAALAPDAEPGHLTLSSGTAARVDYVLTVPNGTYVSVHLPGFPSATLGAEEEQAAWSWSAQPGPDIKPLPHY